MITVHLWVTPLFVQLSHLSVNSFFFQIAKCLWEFLRNVWQARISFGRLELSSRSSLHTHLIKQDKVTFSSSVAFLLTVLFLFTNPGTVFDKTCIEISSKNYYSFAGVTDVTWYPSKVRATNVRRVPILTTARRVSGSAETTGTHSTALKSPAASQ